jgi:hypothetical protein
VKSYLPDLTDKCKLTIFGMIYAMIIGKVRDLNMFSKRGTIITMKIQNKLFTITLGTIKTERKMIIIMLFAAAFLSFPILQANASPVYFNDFQGAVGSEWSSNRTDIAPNTDLASWGRFLGQFGNDTITLSLSGLSDGWVTLSFDTYFIRSWDGSDTTYGPDYFKVSTNTGLILLNDTFSNGNPAGQSYVGNGIEAPAYAGSGNSSMTGSKLQYALGYYFWDYNRKDLYADPKGEAMDSAYNFVFSFYNTSDNLDLIFAGSGLQPDSVTDKAGNTYLDESWGLDNVKVSIPEPSSLLLLVSGALGVLGLYGRSRAKNRD